MTYLKRSKVLLAAAVAAMALSALVASSASASVVAAKYSTPEVMLTTSGITIKKNGAEAKTCTISGGALLGWAEGNASIYSNETGGESKFWCPSPAELRMIVNSRVSYDTVTGRYFMTLVKPCCSTLLSPYGQYLESPGTTGGTWVNGSGTTPSKVTFTNETLGSLTGGGTITISGTFNVVTYSGGLVTLSH